MRHILRAHQLCNEGYQVLKSFRHVNRQILFNNRLSTVWSAPNYCYRCGNRASICEVGDNGTMSFNVFDESPENQIVIKEQQLQNKVHLNNVDG
jgi:serine/threonine-protein phosphatase PPG1